MRLLVIILNYRVTELTLDCLRSLAGRIEGVPGARVTVCENGSGGDAAERLRWAIHENGWSSWADLMVLDLNRGFTGGNNAVIRAALASSDPPQYLLLLNSDTLVHDRALEALVEFMDCHPRAGIAGSQLLSADGVIQPSPFRFPGIAHQLDRGLQLRLVSRLLARWAADPSTPSEPCAAEWVSGASMILRRELLEQIGLLDEGLYTYFDDVDLCLRARRAGWETWYVPQSRITHLEGATTGVTAQAEKRRPGYWYQARRRFYLKNHGGAYAAAADAAFILGCTLRRVRRLGQRRPQNDPPNVLADFVRHSVFRNGFQVNVVENPALRQKAAPPSPGP